jgi:peptidoglycan/xylan/chitin deacetylase (PgdA/CDA1 family)
MPAGWRRPAMLLLAATLTLGACQSSASPSPAASPSEAASVLPSSEPSVAPTPSPTDTPAPTPLASGCQTGERVAAGEPEVFTTIPDAGQAMALTLDMGGRLDPALDILAFLIEEEVCTTLFITGAISETPAAQDVLAVVAEHPELFEVGNHTMHHCNLRSGGGGSPSTAPCETGGPPDQAFVAAELTDAAAIIEAATGQDPAPYWRPPEGAYTDAVLATAASLGYTKTMLWTLDTIDWRPIAEGGPTAEEIAEDVLAVAGSGTVTLMHLGGYETFEALQILVPALRERGLLLTSISDLLS